MARLVGPVSGEPTGSAGHQGPEGFVAVGQIRVGGPVQRPRWWKAFRVGMLLVPLLEIIVFIAVAQLIGGWWAFLLLVVAGLLGLFVMSRGGTAAGQAMRVAMRTGQAPERRLLDSGLTMLGGLMLFLPGFLTDIVGLLLLFPPTKAVARRVFTSIVGPLPSGTVGPGGQFVPGPTSSQAPGPASPQDAPRSEPSAAAGDVIKGEVL